MKKYRLLLIVVLCILEVCSMSLVYRTYQNKPTKNEVKDNLTKKKTFSMYVEKDGEYKEYTESNLFPNNLKYIFNDTESYCVDIKDELVENVITYQDGKVTITSNKTVYCYLYFDLDKIAPQVFTFYLGGSSNPAYTNSVNTKAYLNWSDNDIEKYCLTIGSDSTSCTWNSVSNSPMEIDYTLSSGDGTKTVNAYLKDMAGNISPKVSDNIVLDTAPPQVTASVNNNNTASPTMTITSNETGTYCINTGATSTTDCIFTGSITAGGSITTSAFTTSGDYYAHVTDGVGFVGHSSKVSVTIPIPLGQYIIDNSISGLEKSKIGTDTLYRFSGTSGNTGINNYICLGTTSKCASGSDNMYRIIGVEPSTGYVKVIKQTKYGSNIVWNSTRVVTWPSSGAYSTMRTWYNSISFKNMIVSHSWNIGNVGGTSDTYVGTRAKVISYEDNTTTTAYVGMLSLTDLYMAYRGDFNWYTNKNSGFSSWIGLYQNVPNPYADDVIEWTMTRMDRNYVWCVSRGWIQDYLYDKYSYIVRPTFFLDSDVLRVNGSGTSDDPFLVSE